MIDSLTASGSTRVEVNEAVPAPNVTEIDVEVTEQPARLAAAKEEPAVQQVNRRRYEEEQQYFSYQRQNEPYNYTLSDSETQRFLSRRPGDEYTPDVKATNDNIDQTPKPAGGDQAYNDYINRNRNTLANDVGERQHGKVILLFKINENGRPVDISVFRSLNQTADREAVRLLQNGPDWTSGNKSAYLEIDF